MFTVYCPLLTHFFRLILTLQRNNLASQLLRKLIPEALGAFSKSFLYPWSEESVLVHTTQGTFYEKVNFLEPWVFF